MLKRPEAIVKGLILTKCMHPWSPKYTPEAPVCNYESPFLYLCRTITIIYSNGREFPSIQLNSVEHRISRLLSVSIATFQTPKIWIFRTPHLSKNQVEKLRNDGLPGFQKSNIIHSDYKFSIRFWHLKIVRSTLTNQFQMHTNKTCVLKSFSRRQTHGKQQSGITKCVIFFHGFQFKFFFLSLFRSF